jgi:hypothetical protein
MATRARVLVAAGAALLMAMTGCSLDGRQGEPLPRRSAQPATQSSAATAGKTPTHSGPGASTASPSNSKVDPCASDSTKIEVEELPQESQGTYQHRALVTNTSDAACLLQPAPWTLLQDSGGVVISAGVPLGSGVPIELAPGQRAESMITTMTGESLGSRCEQATAKSLLVGLRANDPRAVRVPITVTACRHLPTVQPIPFSVLGP